MLVELKRANGRRPEYLYNLKASLLHFSRFAQTAGVSHVSQITRRLIEGYMDATETPGNRMARLLKCSTICTFAMRRGWLPNNPCTLIERPHVDRPAPAVWSVETCQRALRVCRPQDVAFLVLGLFAGLRPSEAARLRWECVRLSPHSPHVLIEAAAAKTRRRRIVPLLPVAVALLTPVAKPDGPVFDGYKATDMMRRVLKRNGVDYPQDVLRHTYASMRIAAGAGAAAVASEMGNSEGVLMRHYREVVRPEDAERFWKIGQP